MQVKQHKVTSHVTLLDKSTGVGAGHHDGAPMRLLRLSGSAPEGLQRLYLGTVLPCLLTLALMLLDFGWRCTGEGYRTGSGNVPLLLPYTALLRPLLITFRFPHLQFTLKVQFTLNVLRHLKRLLRRAI